MERTGPWINNKSNAIYYVTKMAGMYVLLSPSVLIILCYFTFLVYVMKFIDEMLLTNHGKLSRISSETRNYDMRKSMCRATPGDSTVCRL